MVENFVKSGFRSQWLQYPRMQVFVRKSERLHPTLDNVRIHCLDIANVEVSEKYRGKGVFTYWLEQVKEHQLRFFDALYVENVQTEKFAHFFETRSWMAKKHVDDCPDICFFLMSPQYKAKEQMAIV